MSATIIFPAIMVVLDIGAAGVFAWHRDWWMVGYWLAAATLTACVTAKGITS